MRLSRFSLVHLGLSLSVMLIWAAQVVLATEDRPNRIISIGNSVTEIVYELGQERRLAGRDRSSKYPPEAEKLPDIGYERALSPEGVLSVDPDLIISLEGAGPPEAIAVLEKANVPFIAIPKDYSRDGVVNKIRIVGQALGEEAAAEQLAQRVGAEIDAAQDAVVAATQGAPKRVMFILSARGGSITVSGTDTSADGIIRMAGAVNAMSDFSGWKKVAPEAIAQAAPDVILMMDRGGDHGAATDELFAMPAMKLTPAARTKAVVRMDGAHLLGFGPRIASAITELSEALTKGQES